MGQTLSLKLTGKDSIAQLELDQVSYHKTHPSFLSIQKEIDRLQKYFVEKGFIDAAFSPLNSKDSIFESTLEIGRQITQIHLKFPDGFAVPHSLQKKYQLQKTDDYYTLSYSSVSRFLNDLSLYISNQGRPFSSLSLGHITRVNASTLKAKLNMTFTKERTLDSIAIKGYEKFPKSFIRYYLRIRKGQAFNKSKIDNRTRDLQQLPFVSVMRSPEVLFTEDKTTLFFYLQKRNSNHFEGFLGFSTDEETNKFSLNGDISLLLRNNLNYGESLSIHYKNSGNDQQHFRAEAVIPYLFSTPIGTELELDLFKQDSSFTTNQQSIKLTYQINPQLQFNVGYQNTNSSNLREGGALVLPGDNENYTSSFGIIGLKYLKPNYSLELFPERTQLALQIGFGSRKREDTKDNQQKVEFSGFHIFDIDERNSIYLANHTSFLLSKEYLNNELYRFGGIHSVRGFEESSLQASFFSGLQTEYRYLLSPHLFIHSIIDYAHIQNVVLNYKDNLYGIGFGLGMQTKAGLLKVDFANGKSNSQSFEFDQTKVHISLTAQF